MVYVTYGTVQCHIGPLGQNKAQGIWQAIQQDFPHLQPHQVLTIGDSPNDVAMFNPECFPISVGVANLLPYCDRLEYCPRFITAQPEAEGFCEVAALLCHRV